MIRFPYGYAVPAAGGEAGMAVQLPLRDLLAKTTVAKLHPEFRRRMVALILPAAKAAQPLGVGTGWRSYAQQAALRQRNPSRSAAAGNSNHEGNNAQDDRDAIAADMVPP